MSRRRNANFVAIAASGFTPLQNAEDASPATLTQHIVLNRPATGDDPLFSMYAPRAVSIEGAGAVLFEPRTQTLRLDERSEGLRSYQVQARPDSMESADGPGQRPRSYMARSIADADGAVARLSRAILKEAGIEGELPAGDDRWTWSRKAAQAFTEYLQSRGGYAYTTDLSSVKYNNANEDPISVFLLKSKRGHCEFFASGLVALCHSVGMPARIAVGYVAYQYDENAQHYDVLESNAHAWGEVLTGPGRWQTFDPTPPATLIAIHSGQATFTDRVRWAVQNVEGNWSSTIVGFDGDSQARLADTLNRSWSARISRALGGVRDWMERVNLFFNVGPGGYIWMGIVALALVIAVIALIKLMRRSLAIRRTLQLQHLHGSEYQRMLRQLGFYLDMLRVLRRGGLAKPYWQPPLQFAGALVKRSPRAAELVGRITDAFYAARYGHERITREQVESVRAMVRELAATLRVRV